MVIKYVLDMIMKNSQIIKYQEVFAIKVIVSDEFLSVEKGKYSKYH
jgi:hypothetical protein